MTGSVRFGLVGTGYWARSAHAPALAAAAADPASGIEFSAVWGRDPGAAADLAARHGAAPHHDLDGFLASVDAVDFAVPPDVQAPIAIRAARAGKHLLLEKPIALTGPGADELACAVTQARVASVVFFTALFQPDVRAWLADVDRDRWLGWRARRLAGHRPAAGQPVQHAVAAGQGRPVGPRPAPDLPAVGQPRPSHRGDRGRRAGRRRRTSILHHAGGATSTLA